MHHVVQDRSRVNRDRGISAGLAAGCVQAVGTSLQESHARFHAVMDHLHQKCPVDGGYTLAIGRYSGKMFIMFRGFIEGGDILVIFEWFSADAHCT